jgi:hypothetical protein
MTGREGGYQEGIGGRGGTRRCQGVAFYGLLMNDPECVCVWGGGGGVDCMVGKRKKGTRSFGKAACKAEVGEVVPFGTKKWREGQANLGGWAQFNIIVW